MHDYWQRQSDQPLFPDLLWSRPEQTAQAGKLLIVGGNAYGFAAPAEAYNEAKAAGIGTARILLPRSIQKVVGRILENGEYAPATPSGSLSRSALDPLLELSVWGDGTLLAGDFGRNSETAILLETFMTKHIGSVILTQDAINNFMHATGTLLKRPDTTVVVSYAQLQKLATSVSFKKAFIFDMDLVRIVETLHEFSTGQEAAIITKHLGTLFVAYKGSVSTTALKKDVSIWRVKTASRASVWQVQNPQQIFAALTTSLYEAK